MPQYLKIYSDLGSRDDYGWPKDGLAVFEDMDDLARDRDRPSERIYELKPAPDVINSLIDITRVDLRDKDEQTGRSAKLELYLKLKKELGIK